MALRIWSRQKWSFEWISEKIPLRRQEQFFTEYRNIYDSTCSTDLNNIVTLTDHHIGNFLVNRNSTLVTVAIKLTISVAILFHLRWQILVGLERHYIRKPPGPVVATGSAVTKAGSLPTWYLEEEKIYSKYGNKDFLLKNIEALKKIQSEIRCALHFPSDEQLKSDTCRTVDQQRSGMKVDPDEINGQISYELGSLYFLQHKYSEAQAAFSQTRLCVDKYGIGKSGLFSK